MTKIDFYIKLSNIIEQFQTSLYGNEKAVTEIANLNLLAAQSGLEIEADPILLSHLENEVDEDEDINEDDEDDNWDWGDD